MRGWLPLKVKEVSLLGLLPLVLCRGLIWVVLQNASSRLHDHADNLRIVAWKDDELEGAFQLVTLWALGHLSVAFVSLLANFLKSRFLTIKFLLRVYPRFGWESFYVLYVREGFRFLNFSLRYLFTLLLNRGAFLFSWYHKSPFRHCWILRGSFESPNRVRCCYSPSVIARYLE
jgi:hypothetical protein